MAQAATSGEQKKSCSSPSKAPDPLIEDFLSYIDSERGLSSNTREAYKRDIEAFHDFITGASLPWPPRYHDILQYMKYLHEKNLEKSSQARKLIAIKVFVKFLFREEIIETNISELLESPKLWQTLPVTLGYQEVEQLIRAPDLRKDEGVRDRAILELLYGAGLRVSELCQLSIYDISDDSVRVRGKGNKERLVPIGGEAIASIDRYLLHVRSTYDSDKETALFVTSRGTRVTREYVWRRVKMYARKIGLQKVISPHTFRHTYASHLLDSGADLRIIQELLGHAHISSTDRYTHLSKSQIQEVFYTFHPRWSGGEDAQRCGKNKK